MGKRTVNDRVALYVIIWEGQRSVEIEGADVGDSAYSRLKRETDWSDGISQELSAVPRGGVVVCLLLARYAMEDCGAGRWQTKERERENN